MMMPSLLAAILLAFANGANDTSKGVASLLGSGTISYRKAMVCATLATFAGSLAVLNLAPKRIDSFSGRGLVPEPLAGSELFVPSVAAGAGVTVFLATLLGFPISTTHALTGAILGCGWTAAGSQVRLDEVGRTFVLPLLLSPLLAIALGGILYAVFHWSRLKLGITKELCLCIGDERSMIRPSSALAWRIEGNAIVPRAMQPHPCVQRYAGRFLGINYQQAVDVAHVMSAGVVRFARGLNDTPKIAALLLVIPAVDPRWSLVAVALAMAVGGLVSAQRVAETMSHRITRMNHGQGFSANLAAGALVIGASLFGLPVSTTHVSCGSLFGIGLVNQQADLRVIRNIAVSWLFTLPCGIAFGALTWWLISTSG